jgi:predicted AAA+ superfamily ATPase
MLQRTLLPELRRRMSLAPAVVLLAPRQAGKTTLARALAAEGPDALVLDMERPSERAMLAEPELFLPTARQRLLVIDEVQHLPGLFAVLRPEIDAAPRPGRLLLLGSASGALLRQSAESLAGRVSYLELTPFLAEEWPRDLAALQQLWLRGGFPRSVLAADDAASMQWRQDFASTLLQRDLPALGLRVPAETLRRFWTMLAHLQGQAFNASQLGQSLGGASHTTVARYLDTLVDAMLVRRLPPLAASVGKRLVKAPKVYVRDSGLLHALLGVPNVQALQGHPAAGPSWEGFVVEQVAAALPPGAQLSYYRTAAGSELDLVVESGGRRLGIEVKFSAAPKPQRGFWLSFDDLRVDQAFVVAPVERGYPLAKAVEVVPGWAVAERVRGWVGAGRTSP